jgi:hypothetical protein
MSARFRKVAAEIGSEGGDGSHFGAPIFEGLINWVVNTEYFKEQTLRIFEEIDSDNRLCFECTTLLTTPVPSLHLNCLFFLFVFLLSTAVSSFCPRYTPAFWSCMCS